MAAKTKPQFDTEWLKLEPGLYRMREEARNEDSHSTRNGWTYMRAWPAGMLFQLFRIHHSPTRVDLGLRVPNEPDYVVVGPRSDADLRRLAAVLPRLVKQEYSPGQALLTPDDRGIIRGRHSADLRVALGRLVDSGKVSVADVLEALNGRGVPAMRDERGDDSEDVIRRHCL